MEAAGQLIAGARVGFGVTEGTLRLLLRRLPNQGSGQELSYLHQKHVYDVKEYLFLQDVDDYHTGISVYRPFDNDTHIYILLSELRYQ